MSEKSDDVVMEEVEINSTDIRLAAMNLLARREHSVLELRRKLRRRFGDESMIEEQLARLAEDRLQCDMRFAECYARQRAERGYGPVRLVQELLERGVSESDIEAGVGELEIDWYTLAAEVMKKKFGTLAPENFNEKARRVRFMQYRGFEAEHYQRLLQNPAGTDP